METIFKELKAELLLKAKNNNACKSGYEQAEKCKTKKELLQVIADNFYWIWTSKTMTIEDLNRFDSELLQSVGIFANYEGDIKSNLNRFIIVGNSSPTIVTYGNSSPRIETYDTSSPRIVTYESSSPRIETCESSSPRISGFENCIIDKNLSLILDIDNSIIYKSDKWQVK